MKELNVLLVGPDYRMSTGWITMDARKGIVADFGPIVLATLAGLAPDFVTIDLWDEPTKGHITDDTQFDRHYDFVGVTGYSGHIDQALRIASVFRKRDMLVGVGGPGVSVHPQAYRDHFDILFIGEAEETWPQFLEELANDNYQKEYRQISKPSLDNATPPKWDGVDTSAYAMGQVQTTRGCPFDCNFCDVIYLFGRKMRHKPIPVVMDEIRELSRQGFSTAFITDDEFVGDTRYTKELLRELRQLNHTLEHPIGFSTQATINASRDPELLELCADAGMMFLFVGVESVNPEAIKNINKLPNFNKDMFVEVRKIMSYGIALRGNTIVGFDEDDTSTFDQLFRFHQDAFISLPAVTILQAPHGTPLWRKMIENGQIIDAGAFERGRYSDDYVGYNFNTLPKNMTRVELMEGYRDLYARLYEWDNIKLRNIGWLGLCDRLPQIPEQAFSQQALDLLLDQLDHRSLLDPAGRRMITEVGDACREIAPTLWSRLKVSIIMQAHVRQSLHKKILPSLTEQIRKEKSGEFKPVVRTFRPPVPISFRQHIRELLRPVYARLEQNLNDPKQLNEAITEVFVDFLVRWGDEFETPAEHHTVFLMELCDRTCAKANGVPPETFVPKENGTPPSAGLIFRTQQDILRNLDLELGFEEKMPHTHRQQHHNSPEAQPIIWKN